MRCAICDKALSEKEVNYNEELGTFEPCTFCLDIIMEAAYSGGFEKEKPDEEEFLVDLDWDNPAWAYQDWSYLSGDKRVTEE